MNVNPYKDWPRLFGPWRSGGWSPPRMQATKKATREEEESYFVEALCWWLSRETGLTTSVVRRIDDGRGTSEPDFECAHDGVTFFVEVFQVFHSSRRMGQLALLEAFKGHLRHALPSNRDWTLTIGSYLAVPPRNLHDVARQTSDELLAQLESSDRGVVTGPVRIRLEPRPADGRGLVISAETGETYSLRRVIQSYREQLYKQLGESRTKLSKYGWEWGCSLVVTSHRTFAAECVEEAFAEVPEALYRGSGGVYWLDLGIPHQVRSLHGGSLSKIRLPQAFSEGDHDGRSSIEMTN